MRYIICPEPITVTKNNMPPQTISFSQYAEMAWYEDRRWQKPVTNMMRLSVVVGELCGPPGTLMSLEDQDWGILKSIIEQPETNHMGVPTLLPSPWFHLQLLPFEDLILKATKERPACLA